MKERIIKLTFILSLMLAVIFLLPTKVFANTYTPNSIDEVKSQIENAVDGDVMDLVNLYNRKEFKPSGNDFSSLGTIKVNSNITIMSSDPKQATYSFAESEGARAVYISNISLDIAEGKTLTMKGHLYLKGPQDKALITGDGNLYLTERMNLSGQNGHPAIYLPKGLVKIENLMSYSGVDDTGVRLKYYSKITGGDSTTHGADAIVAKNVEVNQTNLQFENGTLYTVDRGLFIRGGHGLSDAAQGGRGIKAADITIDLSGELNSRTTPVISGGAGGYGQGAVIGKNIEIKCAGNSKIVSGNGVDLNVNDESKEEFYYGTIEVEDGGHLDFATKDFPGLTDDEKLSMNYIVGGDGRFIDSNGNEASEKFFKGKRWTNFYGPIILANGNASVNIHRGNFTDKGANDNMPSGSQDSGFMYKLPHSPEIEMGSGLLNIGTPDQVDAIRLGCGSHFFNTSEAIISSKADINVYGAKTFVEGPIPGAVTPHTGYSDNPIAPKVGAAGIKTDGKVLLDGANISGGGIYNILSDNGSKKDDYRFGSGIVGAEEVRLVNGAVVQGYGPLRYLRDKKLDAYIRIMDANVSSGYGLENVGTVYVENSEVHGGDVRTENGTPGKGSAGAGIKGANTIEIIGNSLITGGSSWNRRQVFADRLPAGSAIDTAEKASVKGNAKIYGGASTTNAGHGISNVKTVLIEGDQTGEPEIFGGALRQTRDSQCKPAGSSLYMVGDTFIKAGKIEAGDKLYQNFVPAYKEKMHNQTKDKEYTGMSSEAYAISAKGKVIIDGEGQFTPKIMSYTPFDGLVKGEPISTIFLGNDGALYVGKAKVFSGGDENYRDKNILVKGGKYHVDIFKENTINSYEKADNDQGIKYKADGSVALYRILNKNDDGTYSDFVKDELKASAAYDGVFEREFGLLLYKENLALGETVKEKSLVRKSIGQVLETLEVEDAKDITNMAMDNVVVNNETFSITYNANRDSYPNVPIEGNAPVDNNSYAPNGRALVLNSGSLKANGYRFAGWNTKKDGSGQNYNPGDEFEITGNIILFAKWEKTTDKPTEPEKPIDDGRIIFVTGSLGKTSEKEKLELHKAYIYGYPTGNLLPEGKITRAEACAIAIRLKGIAANNMTKVNYQDLEENAWYLPYINEALKLNLLDASDNKLRPNDPITRAEMARLLAPIDKDNDMKSDFKDIIGHKYEKEINKAYGNGRIIGYPDGTFKPDNDITRAEAVKMFNNIFLRCPDINYIDANENFLKKFNDLSKNHWAYYELVEAANTHEYKRKPKSIEEIWVELIK